MLYDEFFWSLEKYVCLFLNFISSQKNQKSSYVFLFYVETCEVGSQQYALAMSYFEYTNKLENSQPKVCYWKTSNKVCIIWYYSNDIVV